MIQISNELVGWNNLWLILLAISSLMVLVNRLDVHSKHNNVIDKILYGGLTFVALMGLFYPVEFGLLGVNIVVTIIMVCEFLRFDKHNNKNKW